MVSLSHGKFWFRPEKPICSFGSRQTFLKAPATADLQRLMMELSSSVTKSNTKFLAHHWLTATCGPVEIWIRPTSRTWDMPALNDYISVLSSSSFKYHVLINKKMLDIWSNESIQSWFNGHLSFLGFWFLWLFICRLSGGVGDVSLASPDVVFVFFFRHLM